MASEKKMSRLRRGRKTRVRIAGLGVPRLCVHRTPKHIYAQVFSSDGCSVVAAASTLDKDFKATGNYGGNVKAAAEVGRAVAERAIAAGIKRVAFDRSGFKYHGRIQALADAAREHGLHL
jgi:large subunit ribosomal protein L18